MPINSTHLEILPITNILDTSPYHALLYYKNGAYHLAAISPLLINSNSLVPSESLLKTLNAEKLQINAIEKYLK